nr:uncharacterized protein LOC109173552 [Ipomoea trifida]
MDPDSSGGGVASPKLRRSCSGFRRWELSPIRYLKLVGGKVVVAALRIMYPAAAKSGARNRKVTSSSSENATPAAAAARLAVDDSHRAEAVKDCIHFMNNISTRPPKPPKPPKPPPLVLLLGGGAATDFRRPTATVVALLFPSTFFKIGSVSSSWSSFCSPPRIQSSSPFSSPLPPELLAAAAAVNTLLCLAAAGEKNKFKDAIYDICISAS